MPEQPLSSRLSLAQAVVSVNSRSKAVSLGLEKAQGAETEGWGQGQPKVKVMGREISVLKRGGYEWREEMQERKGQVVKDDGLDVPMVVKNEDESNATGETSPNPVKRPESTNNTNSWSISTPITSKKSTFVARSIPITSTSQAKSLIQTLLATHPDLASASHNITAFRVLSQSPHGPILEESNDDGENGGGKHLLSVMQSDNIVGMLLIVTRWYGGIMLGTDRWRIMSQVSRDALSQRLRVAGVVTGEAIWGLDLEAMRSKDAPVTGGTAGGMPIYRPEGARAYLLKAFANPSPVEEAKGTKKKTVAVLEKEKEDNLGLLLGALDKLFESWVEHLSRDELDRRAWGYYVQVRPEVDSGVAGWGAKGELKLVDILNLRRKS